MRKIYISLGCALLLQLTNSLTAQVFVNEDFSSATGTTPPAGWTNNEIYTGGGVWAFDNPGGRTANFPMSAPFAIFDSDYLETFGEEAAIESPAFDASTATGDIYLSFYQFFKGDFYGEAYVEVWDGTAWQEVYYNNETTTNPEQQVINITSVANGATDAQVRFRWNGDDDLYWIVDNIKVEALTCPPVTDFALDMTTTNSVSFSWTAGGAETNWDVQYGPAGFALGSGTMMSATNDSITVSLTPDTEYDFYVRANCGADQSLWVGPLSALAGYCYTVGTNEDYYINNFSTTGGSTNISNLNSGFNGYENNTSMAVSSFDGGPDINFSIDFDINFETYGLGIWVDWNNDTIFQSGEQMFISDDYYDSYTGSFGVPTGTPVGNYRMRVLASYEEQAPADACYLDTQEGEVEDYTFTVTAAPACLPVDGVIFTNVADTAISIAWTAQGSETNWVIEYGEAGFTQGTGSVASSSTESFTVDTLTANTQYSFYVQADCGGDSSLWAGPFTAQTGYCDVAGLNNSFYINDFSTSGGATNISNLNSGFNGYADNTSMVVSSFVGGPDINFSIDFDSDGGTYGLGIWVDWNNNSIFEGSEEMFVSDSYYNSFTGSFSVPAGAIVGTYRMRVMGAYNDYDPTDPCFLNADNGDIEDYSFEVIPVPSCLPVTDLTIDGQTTSSVDITWTAGGTETDWDIEYGPAGFTQGGGIMTTSTTESYTAGSLTANTEYDFYVRANCGGGDESYWMGPITAFTGYCQVAGTNPDYFITEFIAAGSIDTIDNATPDFNGYENNTSMVVSSFDGAPAINYSVNFSTGTYGLGIWVDWNNDLVFDATEEMFVSDSYNDSYTGSFAVPAGTPVGTYTMRVMGAYNDTEPTDPCFLNINNGEVEDYTFEVLPQPSCMPVTDLAVAVQTSTSIDIIWTAQGSETSWDIEYGVAGFTPGTGIMGSSSTTSFSASPLLADTDYDFYVRANCGGGDNSVWNHIVGRTGYCVVEGTDSYAFIKNFSTTGGATSNISNLNSGYSANGYQDATTMSVSQFAGGPEINFNINFGNSNYFGCGIWVDWNNNMIFEASEQMFISDDYGPSFSGSFGVPSGTAVGTYRMRVMGTWNDGEPTDPCSMEDEEGEVEDYSFEVVPTPSCLPVSDIVTSNITTNSVDLVWTVNGSEGMWNIQWGPVGFAPGTGAEDGSASSNEVVYTVNGLNPSTTYDLYIQANCGADSSYWTMVTFTTLCAPIANLPWLENFDAMTSVDYGLFPNCWLDEYSDWLSDDINQNNTYNTAPYSDNNFIAIGSFSDDYIWTPEFQLTAGGNYEFSFMWAGAGSSNWDGEVFVNSEQSSTDAVSLGDPFIESSENVDNTYRKVTYCFTPDSTGIYSFGVYVSSFFTSGYLTFDDFRLIERTGSAGTDGTMNVCQTGGLVDLNNVITKDDQTGVWSFSPNPATIVNDSLFNPQFVPSGTVYVNYITTGCMVDTATAIVTIYGPSMAGEDGSISACKNEPLNLLSGLNGTITTGGDWYDPSNAQLPSGQITTGAFPGSFNYRYITGNGICPDDTSLVVVTITNCDWLTIGENELEGVNVYPNPSTGLVYIESTFSTGSFNLVITDVNGRVIENKNNTIVAGTNAVHLENVQRGVYFFKLSNNTAEKVYRIVIE